MRIVKVCEFCKQELLARNTTSQTCSVPCSKRLYKPRQQEKVIGQAEMETMVKRRPEAFMTEEQVRVIQAKDVLTRKPFLTVSEAAPVLNVRVETLRRWIKDGIVRTKRVGKKHLVSREISVNSQRSDYWVI